MGNVTITQADARDLPIASDSVDLVVTSPPFLNLRSYQDGGTHYEGQIGVGTRDQFLDDLWAATAEMKRVIKPTGSIFVELGDSYTDKSLNMSPHRYAIGCVDKLGLLLRAEIIWNRPNGLPESVTDRARRSHSVWFHLTKQPRYYSAVDEIREAYSPNQPWGVRTLGRVDPSRGDHGQEDKIVNEKNPLGKLPGSVWTIPTQPLRVPPELGIDHFAAFPMEWPRRIITGWSPRDVCTACGEGRRPVADLGGLTPTMGRAPSYRMPRVSPDSNHGIAGSLGFIRERTITGYACACTPYTDHEGTGESSGPSHAERPNGINPNPGGGYGNRPSVGPWREYHFDRWTPAPTTPGVVLDPFGGTGTTALVASVLGRDSHHVDLSADYCRLARWRITDPGERARALQVEKPPVVSDDQVSIFDVLDGEAS